MSSRLALLLLALIAVTTALGAEPLRLEDVLRAADARIPQIAAAEAKRRAAEGAALSARGAFDPKVTVKNDAELLGYYERQFTDAYIGGTTPLGVEYTAGYLLGTGDFPSYYGVYETLDGGEFRAGIAAPLLRGLGMTPERAKALAAEAKVDLAAAEMADKRRLVRLKAALSYLKWVKAGESRALAEELLRLAEERNVAIERSVTAGEMARIDLVDNQRVVLERRGELAAARQALQVTAAELSLYYRDDDGRPILAAAEQLPPPATLPAPAPRDAVSDATLALQQRPDLQAIGALLSQALVERRAARAARLPELDVYAVASQDYGQGSGAKAPGELDAGLMLEVPLLNRKARGQLSAAQAGVDRIRAEQQALQDAVTAELLARAADVEAAWSRVQLAEAALDAAREVAALERRSFELGEGDLFRLVKREEAVAKEAKAAIEARFVYRAALLAYQAALAEELE